MSVEWRAAQSGRSCGKPQPGPADVYSKRRRKAGLAGLHRCTLTRMNLFITRMSQHAVHRITVQYHNINLTCNTLGNVGKFRIWISPPQDAHWQYNLTRAPYFEVIFDVAMRFLCFVLAPLALFTCLWHPRPEKIDSKQDRVCSACVHREKRKDLELRRRPRLPPKPYSVDILSSRRASQA